MTHMLAVFLTGAVLLVSAASTGCISAHHADEMGAVATDGTGLRIGQTVVDAELTTRDLEIVSLRDLAEKEGPLVVTFYRGGWCPFCNVALKDWESRLGEIEGAGGKFIAITPEKPDLMSETVRKNELGYLVLSDATNEAAEAFNVLFTIDQATKTKYEGYGIHLEESNASGRWQLPHPATFIIDRRGVVRYAHVDPDYREGRADPGEVIDALKNLE